MVCEECVSQSYRISDLPKLDPIMVTLVDHKSGHGQLIIACFGMSWSAYWNAMGDGRKIFDFVIQADADYIANNLMRNDSRGTSEERYVLRIVDVVLEVLKGLK